MFLCTSIFPRYIFPFRFPLSQYVQITTGPHGASPLLNSATVHSWLVRCSPPLWILKRMHAYPVCVSPSVPPVFLSSPFALPLPALLPHLPLSHWSSLTEKVWNRLRVGPQNKEAWQRFKSVWSCSRMGLCLHWASRRGKAAGSNPQLKALCRFSSQSSN